jgi:outer membrane protein assembly factor BamB
MRWPSFPDLKLRFGNPLPAAAFLMLLSGVADAATRWPQFRGPAASGVDGDAELPTTWDVAKGTQIRWKTPIPGLAHAAPVVWDDRIYVATAVKPGESDLKVGLYGDIQSVEEPEPQQWRLLALDRTSGRVIWNTLALEAVPRVKRHTKASHCNSTPATDGRRIAALFGSEGLFVFDLEGKLIWKKDLGPLDSGYFESPTAQWGFASSPVIHEGRVIVQADVQKGSFLAVYDLESGKEIWKQKRSDVPTWSSPTVVESEGRKQIAVNGWHHIGGYDFSTGRELWRLDGGGDIPVPTPIFAHGLIYLTSAHGKVRPMRAVRPGATGDVTPKEVGQTNAAIAWVHPRQGNSMQTPLVVGDLLYACLDSGILTCFDARTGVIRYGERVVQGGEGFTASTVSDGKHLFVTSENGNVYVVPTGPKFSVVSTNRMDETCMSSPAIAGGALLYRTRGHLVSIGK